MLGDVLESGGRAASGSLIAAVLARHGGRARRHDDGRLGVARGDAGVNTDPGRTRHRR